MNPTIYSFTAYVQRTSGSREGFSVEIARPEDSGKGDSVCRLSCPFLADELLSIHGVDPAQALDLSRRFVEASLEGVNARLVDAEGNPVELPPLPVIESRSRQRSERPTAAAACAWLFRFRTERTGPWH